MKESSEHVEQRDVIQWCNIMKYSGVKELGLIFAVPNGGLRNITTAVKLKAEGVKSGVPDLMLPVSRKDYHGLFIEMKREKSGKMSEMQLQWRDDLKEQGYYCVQCRGSAMAISALKYYLDLE